MTRRKNIARHRLELRLVLREFGKLVPKGREVSHFMIREGVNKLIAAPASDEEITSLIGWAVDKAELRARHDDTLEETFFTFA